MTYIAPNIVIPANAGISCGKRALDPLETPPRIKSGVAGVTEVVGATEYGA